VLWDRDIRSLKAFLSARRGYYDLIWISRAHNLRQLLEVMGSSTDDLGHARIVLDTEAVFSVRDAGRAELDGLPFDMTRALRREFESTWRCDHIVATSAAEAAIVSGLGSSSVGVIGVRQDPRPGPRPFAGRRGLLHVGTLTSETSPNYDGLRWFVTAILPLLERLLGAENATLTVVGHLSDEIDLSWLRDHPRVRLLGSAADLAPLFDAHRVLVAPTRFGAGIPVKVLDAAASGIPVAATALLAQQLDWTNRRELACAPHGEPDAFAHALAELYADEHLWNQVRKAALAAVAEQASAERFERQLLHAVQAAGATVPRMPAAFTAATGVSERVVAAMSGDMGESAEEVETAIPAELPGKPERRSKRRTPRELSGRERRALESHTIRPS
jgi:glycosyltransferase involved in cell wall biosynthesis